MTMEQTSGTENQDKNASPKRVRSPYLFPAYNFTLARQIAERVESDGAGNLSEATLAIALHLSATSSGFKVKVLTARQFGLLTRQGEILSTTPLAKRIFKPMSNEERQKAMAESFLAIPLFREVASRFKGQPLPQGQTLRNILEREFRIDSKRVSDAERVLLDSARDAGVLVVSGANTYITTDRTLTPSGVSTSLIETPIDKEGEITPPSPPRGEIPQAGEILLTVSIEDFKDIKDDKEFNDIWNALGKLVKVKSKRLGETQTKH